MGGKSALLADLEDDEDDNPSALLADIEGPDAPATPTKGPLELEWEKRNGGASLDAVGADALSTYTDPSKFAERMGGAGLKLGLGAATQGTGLMSMLSTILTGGGTGGIAAPAKSAGGVMGALGATGKDVASQGAQGAVAAAADSMQAGDDHKTMLQRILSAGGMGGLAELGANVIGGGAGKLGEGMEWAAKKAKNVVAGSNSKEATAVLDKLGPDADVDMFGKLLDKYSPTGLFSSKSAGGHLDKSIGPQAEVQGQRVGQMINKAGYDEGVNDLVPDAWKKFQGDVDERALDAMRRPAGGEARDFAGAMGTEADEVRKMSQPEDLAEFVRDKSGFQSAGAQKGAVGYAEGARARANQAVGGIGKDAVDDLMSNAQPDTYARWDNARGQKSELEMLKSVLAAKKAGESTAGDIGSTIGSGVVGGVLGGVAGAATGDNAAEGAGIGAAGALAGAFGLTGGATKTAVRQLGGSGLADFGANVARSGGKALSGLGDFASALPTGGLAARGVDAAADENASRGYMTNSLLDEAMQQNPRMLGKYQYIAKMEPDERKLEISRLQDDDENFRRLITNLHSAAASMRQ